MDTFKHTPIIGQPDVLVIGSTIAAMSIARCAVSAGYSVMIATSDTCLYSEIVVSELLEVASASPARDPWYDELFPDSVDANVMRSHAVRLLHPDRLKIHGERWAEANGIGLLYTVWPLAHGEHGGRSCVTFGTTSGCVAMTCSMVFDMRFTIFGAHSECILNIMGAPADSSCYPLSYGSDASTWPFSVTPGSFGHDHATIRMHIPDATDMESYVLQEQALACMARLARCDIRFSTIRPGRCSARPYTRDFDVHREIERGRKAWHEKKCWQTTCSRTSDVGAQDTRCHFRAENSTLGLFNLPLYHGMMSDIKISKTIQCDVLVVGGGTAGAMAALAAAQEGKHVLLIEACHQLGGTSTIGGVNAYWYGKRFADVQHIDSRIEQMYRSLSLSRTQGPWGSSDNQNPTIRSAVLERLCRESCVDILLGTMACAAIVERSSLGGILAINDDGPTCIETTIVIDATGNGDIAALAGARVVYGAERDHATFWASLAQYPDPERYANNFSTCVVVDDPRDVTRFIRLSRTRGASLYDHGMYLATRESRHLLALKTLSLRDVLSWKRYDDTVLTCFSNYDPKGISHADLIQVGFLPPPMTIAIPLSAMIPVCDDGQILANLLVVGKAFGSTHDAFPALRMQTDMMHQGTVAGLACALAVAQQVDLCSIDMAVLHQNIWLKTKDPLTLPGPYGESIQSVVESITSDDAKEWTDLAFTEEIVKQPRLLAAALAPSADILPLLEKRYHAVAEDRLRLILAQLLLWHGSDAGTDTVLQAIAQDLASVAPNRLPPRRGSMMCVQLLPDHGVMAETAYLLNLLAFSKRDDIHLPFVEILRRLKTSSRDYRDNRLSTYGYLASCAFVAERNPLEGFIPLLCEAADFPEIRTAKDHLDSADVLHERLAMLSLSLVRAIARCGDYSGYSGLLEFLDCQVLSLRLGALAELRALTSVDAPLDRHRWAEVIEALPHPVPKQPLDARRW